MDTNLVIDVALQSLIIAAKLAAPLLITALVVGFAISLFQSVTQIQESTIAFVPKLCAVGLALLIAGHWMITEMVTFTHAMFDKIPAMLG